MANRVDSSAYFRADELLSITRNPLPFAATQVHRGRFDVGLVVPSHVDPNWFDATWYGEPRKSCGIGASIVRLAAALTAVHARVFARAGRSVVLTALQGQWR